MCWHLDATSLISVWQLFVILVMLYYGISWFVKDDVFTMCDLELTVSARGWGAPCWPNTVQLVGLGLDCLWQNHCHLSNIIKYYYRANITGKCLVQTAGRAFSRNINLPEGRLLSGWFSGIHGRCCRWLAETDTQHNSHQINIQPITSLFLIIITGFCKSWSFYTYEDRE